MFILAIFWVFCITADICPVHGPILPYTPEPSSPGNSDNQHANFPENCGIIPGIEQQPFVPEADFEQILCDTNPRIEQGLSIQTPSTGPCTPESGVVPRPCVEKPQLEQLPCKENLPGNNIAQLPAQCESPQPIITPSPNRPPPIQTPSTGPCTPESGVVPRPCVEKPQPEQLPCKENQPGNNIAQLPAQCESPQPVLTPSSNNAGFSSSSKSGGKKTMANFSSKTTKIMTKGKDEIDNEALLKAIKDLNFGKTTRPATPGTPTQVPGNKGQAGQMPVTPGTPGTPTQVPGNKGQPGQMPVTPGTPGTPTQVPGGGEQPGQMPVTPGTPGTPTQVPGGGEQVGTLPSEEPTAETGVPSTKETVEADTLD